MPAKRGRGRGGDQLTGGSGDVNPQFLSFSVAQTGNDAATSGSVSMPFSLSSDQNTECMEILKITYENITPNGGVSNGLVATLSNKNFGTTQPALGLGM